MEIMIRELREEDAQIISNSFKEQGWEKPVDLYMNYLEEQNRGERVSLIAEVDGAFAGYVNVIWKSYYPSFVERGIPEINDLNVLITYRRQGIGSQLMDKAEEIMKGRSGIAGIGVGLTPDYGNAQILYVRRGYIPDGKGIHNGQHYITNGESAVVNDDLVMYLTKQL